ncbi:phage exclusion protein Lit family protein [Pedobacter aquatilis]|uniref:phage exclusion protein Lit family protein n=1 Tax=Pedobacter aquatilis TaxID=351343 RepID=UPI00292F94F9|nr:phage exclusion protein Lit family protein [Pedobacter aquatilis]
MEKAQQFLEKIKRNSYAQLSMAFPEWENRELSLDQLKDYLKNDPDYKEEILAEKLKSLQRHDSINDQQISNFERSTTYDILAERVNELRNVISESLPEKNIENIYFGTIPGGGLNAYTQKVPETNDYVIIIPDGLFNLINLSCKLVALLQPWEQSAQGLVYMQTASYLQLYLSQNPYINFRCEDLLRAFFLNGDPRTAVPYKYAVPHQERLSYLLVGTELFILMHEVAHIFLGHLEKNDAISMDDERAADQFAVTLLTSFFKQKQYEFPEARSVLCATLFHNLNSLWEQMMLNISPNKTLDIISHPAALDRWLQFVNDLENKLEGKSPHWYIYIHNAMQIAFRQIGYAALDNILKDGNNIYNFSARILPDSLVSYGHLKPFNEKEWVITVAKLVNSVDEKNRLTGLYLLNDRDPDSIIGLYLALLSDDKEFYDICKKCLISLEPIYMNYFPRLLELIRQADREDRLFEYLIDGPSFHLGMKIRMQLGDIRLQHSPLHPSFYQ